MKPISQADLNLVLESGLFDSAWYSSCYSDVRVLGMEPWSHFQRVGIHLRRNPCLLFDSRHYLQQRAQAGASPLPEIPLLDYLKSGWREGLDPHPFFDVSFYLEKNPDVALAAVEPLGHYYRAGGKEGRSPHPIFDPAYYRESNPEATISGIDPLIHFVKIGFAEGRPPNALYSARDYADLNPDVIRAGMHPTLHYALYGFQEGRRSLKNGVGPSYTDWLRTQEGCTDSAIRDMANHVARMKIRPTISVVMPVYNTKANWLREAIDSVRGQIYPHWQLCIADDASTVPHVREILEHYRSLDSRIHIVFRPESGHISAASNSALELASGDFVALLDHDDVLPEHALYHVAARLEKNPDAMILYSDEDKLAEDGSRTEPHFKSDWNPDLFYSQNYICHLCVIRRSILKKIGGFRIGVEGSQDHDLLLRCLPYVNDKQIHHIPRILYHWRIHPQSTAQSSSSKSYTTEAALKALSDYFNENGSSGIRVEQGLLPNTYRIRWPIPAPGPLATLLIPTRNHRKLVETAVSSILQKTDYRDFEILILDNGSTDPDTLKYFDLIQREDSRVRVIPYPQPFNYSAINNFGVTRARGSLVGFINNDIEVISPGWLGEMVSHALRPSIGCVGAKLYYSDNTLQHAGVFLGIGGVAGHSHKHLPKKQPGYFSRTMLPQNISAVTAACLVMRKSVFEEVGGFDEKNLTVAFNDVDLCLKVREAGYRNLWTPYAELYHHESVSRGQEDSPEKIKRFQSEIHHMKEKWGEKLLCDPYYNENLTREREDFSLR